MEKQYKDAHRAGDERLGLIILQYLTTATLLLSMMKRICRGEAGRNNTSQPCDRLS